MTDQELYNVVMQIAEFIARTVKDAGCWMDDRRKDGVNPFYNQTQQGLFLEFYYGTPSSLWTPWGKFRVGGSGAGMSESWHMVGQKVIVGLGATVYQPLRIVPMGDIGPTYAIHSFNGIHLPDPVERDHNEYLDYDEARQAWEKSK